MYAYLQVAFVEVSPRLSQLKGSFDAEVLGFIVWCLFSAGRKSGHDNLAGAKPLRSAVRDQDCKSDQHRPRDRQQAAKRKKWPSFAEWKGFALPKMNCHCS